MNKSLSHRPQRRILNSNKTLQRSKKTFEQRYDRDQQSCQFRQIGSRKSLQNYLSNRRWTIDVPRHLMQDISPFGVDCKNSSIRQIKREKKLMTQEIQSSLRQSRYLEARQRHQERIISMLENRNNKINQIRKEKIQERVRNKQKMVSFEQETYAEKKEKKGKIDQMKANLIFLKHTVQQSKKYNAQNIREMHQEEEMQSSTQYESELEKKKNRCQIVKRSEKLGAIRLKKLNQEKFHEILMGKRKRMLTELSEKSQIQLVSQRVKEEITENLMNYSHNISLYEQKIALLRQKLGDSRYKYTKSIEKGLKPKSFTCQTEEYLKNQTQTL